MTTASFWDDASNIEELTYRMLLGESVSMPPRVPAPRFDATLPTQLVQLEQLEEDEEDEEEEEEVDEENGNSSDSSDQ